MLAKKAETEEEKKLKLKENKTRQKQKLKEQIITFLTRKKRTHPKAPWRVQSGKVKFVTLFIMPRATSVPKPFSQTFNN